MEAFQFLKNLLFIDIETASLTRNLEDLSPRLQAEWAKKARKFDPKEEPDVVYEQRAAILAEFGKVIAIGAGYFVQNEQKALQFRVKCFYAETEKEILEAFKKLVEERFDPKKLTFVAHNGKDFDYPFLCRRMLVNQIPLPRILQLLDKKPWEVPHMDTMQMWRFGESRHYVSLELLAAIFDIPSSKEDLEGRFVSRVYHEGETLERIAAYCRNDVVVTARVFLKMHTLPGLSDEQIVMVP